MDQGSPGGENLAARAAAEFPPAAGRPRGRLNAIAARLALLAGAPLFACVLVLAGLSVVGYPPVAVLATWLRGAAGSGYAIGGSLTAACPLLLTGLAAGVAFKSGVLNIGGEGQFLVGALAATALTTSAAPPGPSFLVIAIALAAGAAAGAVWGLLAGVLERFRGVPVVLSTILLNFVAVYLVRTLLQGPLEARHTAAPQSSQLPPRFWLPTFFHPADVHLGVFLALGVAAVLFVVQRRTTFGFEMLVAGLNPDAAAVAGMPVARRQLQVLALAASCAGLGGAVEVLGVSHFMSSDYGGYGYAGIAVALLGALDPLGTAAAALFFGMLDTGARYVEESRLALPADLAGVVKGLVLLAVVAGGAWLAKGRRTKAQG